MKIRFIAKKFREVINKLTKQKQTKTRPTFFGREKHLFERKKTPCQIRSPGLSKMTKKIFTNLLHTKLSKDSTDFVTQIVTPEKPIFRLDNAC